MDSKRLKTIANKVRNDFENDKINIELLKKLYQKYNPLEDIGFFVKRSQQMFPRLNCGIATVYLKHILKRGAIIQGKYRNNNHTFLLLNKNIVVDITVDQYNGPRVFVGKLGYPWCKTGHAQI